MASTNAAPLSTTKLELRTAYGPVFRDVLNTPPRDCTAEEIPVIDLVPLYSEDLEDRKALAKAIRAAAVNTGFFYIKNHGIEEEKIANAKKQLLVYVPFPLKPMKSLKIRQVLQATGIRENEDPQVKVKVLQWMEGRKTNKGKSE